MANNEIEEPSFVMPETATSTPRRPIVERPDYQAEPRFQLPENVGPPKPDYEQMPIYEAAGRGLMSAPKSFFQAAIGVPMMLAQPRETGAAVKSIWQGAMSSQAEKNISELEKGAAGETGKQLAAEFRAKDLRTPEQKAEIEEPWNRFKAPYTSWAGFKETLATDPFALIPLGGGPVRGVGRLVKGGEGANLARQVIGSGITGAGYAMEPVESTLALTGKGLRSAKEAVKADWAGMADVPEEAVDIAYMTAKSRGPQHDAAKQSFATWFNGSGSVDDFQKRTITAFEKIKNNAFQQWKNQKKNVVGQSGDVPVDPIIKAIDERRAVYGNYDLATPEGKRAIDALNQMRGNVVQRSSLPPGHPDRSVEALDSYKIQLGMEADANPSLSNDYMAVYNGVKNAINDIAPEYQNLMDTYREMNRHMLTLQKATKAKDTASAIQSVQSFYKLLKTPEGMQLAREINAIDPTILPSVAGSALSRKNPNVSGMIDKTGIGGALMAMATTAAAGFPEYSIIAGGAVPILRAGQTPRNLGSLARTSGKIAGSRTGQGLAGAGSFVRQTASPAATFMENLRRTEEDLRLYPPEEETQPRANGGRMARADGGRIDIDRGVRALMRAAEQAKKSISKSTETLLEQPDEHIAQALNMAKKHI